MISSFRNTKSLTFYQPIAAPIKKRESSFLSESASSMAVVERTYQAFTTTSGYNNQLNAFLEDLHASREELNIKLAEKLADNPSYKGLRNQGVKLAWEYEQADVEMGGSGSEQWTKQEKMDILENGKVRGAEGHHQKNVADHPIEQANPDNIKFFRTREEHLQKGHDGNWKNQTDGEMTNKDQMLENTNSKRVFSNELQGIRLAIAIGTVTGFTIGFASTLAFHGVSPDSIRNAFVAGAKISIEAGVLSGISYGMNRTIGMIASSALVNGLSNAGIQITENISHMCSIGSAGFLSIGLFSVYQFIKLRMTGYSTKAALVQSGKQAAFSISTLAVVLTVQKIIGGNSGIIVSISIGVVYVAYSLINTAHERVFADKLQTFIIEQSRPSYVT